jgi:hypothetical protein
MKNVKTWNILFTDGSVQPIDAENKFEALKTAALCGLITKELYDIVEKQ